MNPYVKHSLGSAILLKYSWKNTQQNYIGFNPFSFFKRYIHNNLDFLNRHSGIKICYNWRTSSNKILGGTSAAICMKWINNEMWNARRNMHESFLYSHLAGDDCTMLWERWSLERACNMEKNSHVFPLPLLQMHF